MKIQRLQNNKFSLQNTKELTLIFLGVGSAFSRKHYQTNLLIIKGKDHLLIDCGSTCPISFYESGISILEIRNFLITHSHADHIGGLEEVMLRNRYILKKKPNIIITKEFQDILWYMSLQGGTRFNEREVGEGLQFEDFWNIIRPKKVKDTPRESYEIDIGKINIKMMRTMHIPDSSQSWKDSFWSCGVVVDNRVLFTADTRFDEELIYSFNEKFNLEAIFHDCQFIQGGVHASLEELKRLPMEIKNKIYLTHYGDNWENFVDKIKEYGFQGLAEQKVLYIFD